MFAAYAAWSATRDRVAGAGFACSPRPDLHTICRSFLKSHQIFSAKLLRQIEIGKKAIEPQVLIIALLRRRVERAIEGLGTKLDEVGKSLDDSAHRQPSVAAVVYAMAARPIIPGSGLVLREIVAY